MQYLQCSTSLNHLEAANENLADKTTKFATHAILFPIRLISLLTTSILMITAILTLIQQIKHRKTGI